MFPSHATDVSVAEDEGVLIRHCEQRSRLAPQGEVFHLSPLKGVKENPFNVVSLGHGVTPIAHFHSNGIMREPTENTELHSVFRIWFQFLGDQPCKWMPTTASSLIQPFRLYADRPKTHMNTTAYAAPVEYRSFRPIGWTTTAHALGRVGPPVLTHLTITAAFFFAV